MNEYFILAKCEVEGNVIRVAVLSEFNDENGTLCAVCYGNNKLFFAHVNKNELGHIIGLKFIGYITASDCVIYDADEEFKRLQALEELEGNDD